MRILILALFFSGQSFAQDMLICSILNARKAASQVNSQLKNDKAKHCAVSCMLSLKCNSREVYTFGLLKELADLLGTGTPEQADIEANKVGIMFADSGMCKTDSECLETCKNQDWRQLRY